MITKESLRLWRDVEIGWIKSRDRQYRSEIHGGFNRHVKAWKEQQWRIVTALSVEDRFTENAVHDVSRLRGPLILESLSIYWTRNGWTALSQVVVSRIILPNLVGSLFLLPPKLFSRFVDPDWINTREALCLFFLFWWRCFLAIQIDQYKRTFKTIRLGTQVSGGFKNYHTTTFAHNDSGVCVKLATFGVCCFCCCRADLLACRVLVVQSEMIARLHFTTPLSRLTQLPIRRW